MDLKQVKGHLELLSSENNTEKELLVESLTTLITLLQAESGIKQYTQALGDSLNLKKTDGSTLENMIILSYIKGLILEKSFASKDQDLSISLIARINTTEKVLKFIDDEDNVLDTISLIEGHSIPNKINISNIGEILMIITYVNNHILLQEERNKNLISASFKSLKLINDQYY